MNNTQKAFLAILLIIVAASTRIFDHEANFTPVMAIAVFGGAIFKRIWALIVPVAIMLLSDIAIEMLRPGEGFYSFQIVNYLAFLIVVLSSMGLLRNKITPLRALGASLGASLIFFVVSNFGSWIALPEYEKSISGLITCYYRAIPFAWPEVKSTLLFSGVFFAVYQLSIQWLFKSTASKIRK